MNEPGDKAEKAKAAASNAPNAKADKARVKKEIETEDNKGKTESRLEFLSRMYEARKAQQVDEETTTDDEETTDE